MMKVFSIILAAVTLCAMAADAERSEREREKVGSHQSRESGFCGPEVKYSIDDSTLTISGQGAISTYNIPAYPYPWYMSDFTTLIIEEGVTYISDYAFAYSFNLTNVSLPSTLTAIGQSAFNSCTNLSSITIPPGVTTIGGSTFYNCSSLVTVVLPSTLEEIGPSAFSSCSNLSSVVIPPNVKSIGSTAFQWCTSLSSVTIPPSVTKIGMNAFRQCSSLTQITIPESISFIEGFAFCNCDKLTSVTFLGTQSPINNDQDYVFDSSSSIEVCVPEVYNDSQFCGIGGIHNSVPNETTFNFCYEMICDGNEGIKYMKRKSTILWEEQTDACAQYFCINETGLVWKSLCKDREVCENGMCVESQHKWKVTVDFNDNVHGVTEKEIISSISEETGIDPSKLKIHVEVDSDGKPVSVTVFVNDEKTANKISDTLAKCGETD